jgi:hypothetical protein
MQENELRNQVFSAMGTGTYILRISVAGWACSPYMMLPKIRILFLHLVGVHLRSNDVTYNPANEKSFL